MRVTGRRVNGIAGLLAVAALVISACGGGEIAQGPRRDTGSAGGSGSDVSAPADASGANEDGRNAETSKPDAEQPPSVVVETDVTPPGGQAGTAVTIGCSATDEDGEALTPQPDFEILVTPETGGALEGSTFTPESAGSYEIACRALPEGPRDDSPFVLVVQPGPAALVRAELDPAEVAAGEPSQVTCRLLDAFDNDLTALTWTVEAPEGVAVTGLSVTATTAGEHEIRCLLAGPGEAELANEPAVLVVVPGAPQRMALRATPSRRWHELGGLVTIGYEVYDAHDNVVPDIDWGLLTVTITPPAGMAEEDTLRYRFEALGVYQVHGSVAGPPAAEADTTLYCDPDRPIVTIDQPDRGLTHSNPASVTVIGTAGDEVSGLASLTVNGAEVTVAPDGAFSAPIVLTQGMNVITVRAEDAAGHEQEVMRAVYFSPIWYHFDPAMPLGAVVHGAVEAFASRLFFYAEQDPGKTTVSSLVGQILEGLDLGSFLPSPVAEMALPLCGVESAIYLSDIQYAVPAQVNLRTEENPRLISNPALNPIDGGVHLFARLVDFSTYLRIDTPGGGLTCLNSEGRIMAEHADILADLFVSLDGAGNPRITIENVTLRVEGLSANTGDLAGALINLGSEWIEEILGGMVSDMVVGQLGDLIGGLAGALALDLDFELGPFFGEGDPVPLHLSTTLGGLDFRGSEPGAGVSLAVDGSITGPEVVDHPVLGSIGRASCLGLPEVLSLAQTGEVELAAFDDVLNEALFALWRGGLLHMTITEEDLGGTDLSQYGITGLAVETAPLLPPIITSCNDEDQLVAQVGDFWLHATFTFPLLGQEPIDITAYLYAEIALDPVVVDGEAGPEPGIRIGEVRFLLVDILSLNEEQERNRDAIRDLLQEALPSLALSQLAAEPISFAIPPIDLSSFDSSGILPGGIVLQVVIDALGHTLGHALAEGHVEQGSATP